MSNRRKGVEICTKFIVYEYKDSQHHDSVIVWQEIGLLCFSRMTSVAKDSSFLVNSLKSLSVLQCNE